MAIGDLVTRSGYTIQGKVKGYTLTGLTTISGTFAIGETVTGGTSSATGKALFFDVTNTELVLYSVTGTFQASETVTGGTSSASASVGTVGGAGNYNGTWATLANIDSDPTITRSRPANRITFLDSDEEDPADTIFGNLEMDGSFSLAIVPGGDAFNLCDGAIDANADFAVKVAQADRNAANTRTRYYVGGISNASETMRIENAGSMGIQVAISDKYVADPT